jgi:hypothetical protein
MDNREDLDARAQAMADAVRKLTPLILWVILGAFVLAVLVVVVVPNVVLLLREYQTTP